MFVVHVSPDDTVGRQPLIKGPVWRHSDVACIVPQWARRCVEGDRPMFLDADPGLDKVYKRVGFHSLGETYGLTGNKRRREHNPA